MHYQPPLIQTKVTELSLRIQHLVSQRLELRHLLSRPQRSSGSTPL